MDMTAFLYILHSTSQLIHSDQFRDECEFDFNVYSSWNSICFEGLIAVQVSVK